MQEINQEKTIIQQRVKIESVQRVIDDLKKDIHIYKNQIRNVSSQLQAANEDFQDLKKFKNAQEIEIEKLKKEKLILEEQNEIILMQKAQLNNQLDISINENQRFVTILNDLQDRSVEINSKIAEIKKYFGQLALEQKQYKLRLKNYEQDNNLLSENIGYKQDNIDNMEVKFQMKHDQIKNDIEHYIQLQHANDKVIRQILHICHLLKNQNEKTNEFSNLIQKNEKMQYEKINKIKEVKIQSAEIEIANREILNQNDKMKRDMVRCQEHLENLVRQNAYIQQSMDNYLFEDQAIVNVITRKVLPYMKSNSRMRTRF